MKIKILRFYDYKFSIFHTIQYALRNFAHSFFNLVVLGLLAILFLRTPRQIQITSDFKHSNSISVLCLVTHIGVRIAQLKTAINCLHHSIVC